MAASITAVAVSPASETPPIGTRPAPTARFTLPAWLIATAGVIAAVIAGAALARDPALGLVFVAACAFLSLVLLSLPLALAAWIPVAWNEASHVAGSAPLAGALLLLTAWIGTRRVRGAVVASERSVRIARIAFVLLLLWITLSISWASDRWDAWFEVKQWYFAGVVFLIISTVATTPARVRLIALMFIAGALTSIVIGLVGAGTSTTVDSLDLATRQRFSGGAGDPNYLAAGLIAAIALVVGLMASARGVLAKIGLGATALAFAAAILATESRGGLVATMCAFVAALVLARGRRVQAAAFAIVAVTSLLALAPASVERMTTFESGGNGRNELWSVAARMAGDHPIAGVGIRGFKHESQDYVQQPGNLTFAKNIVSELPAVPHNVYLQQLAETGVVGLLALLVVFGACLAASQIAAGRFRAGGDRSMAALARATTVALIGLLAASFFLSNATDKRLWIVLALGPALLAAAGPPTGTSAQLDSTPR